ncbi:MAG TPA: MscL family protein [Streptosporangiaceae bacterium]|nr:MscL family protein [Streptosporangiaceae bacterium]
MIVVAVGLVIALAFSTLILAFTNNIITPLVNAVAGGGAAGKGLGWTLNGQRIDLGAFISAVIYFAIFMSVVYFFIVVPYRAYMKRRGAVVFGNRSRSGRARRASRTTFRPTRPSASTAPARSRPPREGRRSVTWMPGRRRP